MLIGKYNQKGKRIMRQRALAATLFAAVLGIVIAAAPDVSPAAAQDLPGSAVETEPFVSPLAPLDTSTPRATLAAVRDLGRDLDAAYLAYHEAPSFALQGEIRRVLARTDSVFDLATTPSALRAAAGAASFGYLKDILMRLPAIDPATLPGDAGTAPDRLRLPGTEIELGRVSEGPRAGAYLFSADTVERLPEFHARIIGQPILQPAPYESWRVEQIRFTGPFVPGGLVRAMPEPMQVLILGTPLWKVLFSTVVLAGAGMAAFRWAEHAGLRAAAAGSSLRARYWRLTQPLGLGALTLLSRGYLIGQVNLSGRFFEVIQALTLGTAVLAAAGVVRGLFLIAGEHVNASARLSDRLYDRHLVRLVSGVGGLAAACFVVLWGANSLGVPLLGLVAGMGVGGIALALAAQSTIENLFAGVSLFADRPFRVGDTIIYAGGEGTVESIGPRSTRIRAPDGMQITVPNADLAKMQVTNKTCRDATLFRHVVALRQDTTPAQITDFCRRVMDLLETYPVDGLSELPPRVRLIGIGDGAMRVEVQAEFLAESEDDFYRLQESLLLSILGLVETRELRLSNPLRRVQVSETPATPRPAAVEEPAAADPAH